MSELKFIKYPSIPRFEAFRKSLLKYHPEVKRLTLHGSVKIHGTNAGIILYSDDTVAAQSRERTLEIGKDNAGFAAWATGQQIVDWLDYRVIDKAADCDALAIYGEWCGGNVQKGVGVSGMDKAFVIFDIHYVTYTGEVDEQGTEILKREPVEDLEDALDINFLPDNVYRVDWFDSPAPITVTLKEFTNELLQPFTDKVEEQCPVAAELNSDSDCQIGEGLVWTVRDANTGKLLGNFKHKGEKHERQPKAPRVQLSDDELNVRTAFAQKVLTTDRMLQAIEVVKSNNNDDFDMRNIGEYLKWVNQDILKECEEDLVKLSYNDGLEWKQVAGTVTKMAKEFYISEI